MSFSSKFKRIEIVISFHASAMNFQRIFDKSCRTRENSHLSDSTRRSSMQTGGEIQRYVNASLYLPLLLISALLASFYQFKIRS